MLPPFIIEQIRKREEEDVRPEHRPVVDLPLPPRRHRESDAPAEERGVVVIDLSGDE